MSGVRCFVAADLPADLRDELGRLQKRLAACGLAVRWVSTEAMHLTVRFLGELAPRAFEDVAAALTAPLEVGGPCRLEPGKLGAFPTPRRARVLWVDIGGEVATLARAALLLEARLEPLGIPRELRPFRPHLTLGRARGPSGILGAERALEAEGAFAGPAFTVDRLILYESRLRPGGPSYVPRGTIPLT